MNYLCSETNNLDIVKFATLRSGCFMCNYFKKYKNYTNLLASFTILVSSYKFLILSLTL